ncbi:MAG: ABC transporter ATP-binding protein [Clostridia bacterium]|nr:ABC transporter ATP-binding protein [Clostridia bacterium]
MEEILRVENLKKTFPLSAKQRKAENTKEKRKTALAGASFSAYRGEIFGLLGPNGAGKTTTLRILSTLIKADEGDAFINGKSVRREPEAVRAQIGFLTSELKLEAFFSPDYLFNFFSDLHNVPLDVREQRKKALFEKFGIDKYAFTKVGDLSTGMKQKVSLVISIVQDPDIIIFDEPTNGLDVLTAKVVTDFLLELKAQGKTIILSTHIFSLIEKICDRVCILIDGKVVCESMLKELTAEKNLEDKFFDIYREVKGEEV